MTQLLVSVRDAHEARTAFESGADIVDIKEPARGSLGAAERDTIDAIHASLPADCTTSVALGELVDGPTPSLACGRTTFAKVGLANTLHLADWERDWIRLIERLPASVRAVGVIYADWQTCGAPSPERVIACARNARCDAVLLDTFEKSQGGLLDRWQLSEVTALVESLKRCQLRSALAGSLTPEMIERLLPLEPDWIAVRAAACDDGRQSPLSAARVRYLKQLLRVSR